MRWFCGSGGLSARARAAILTSGGSLATFSALVAARARPAARELPLRHALRVGPGAPRRAEGGAPRGFPAGDVREIRERRRSSASGSTRSARRSRPTARRASRRFSSSATPAPRTPAPSTISRRSPTSRARERLWLHVDAAYGGFFLLTEEGRRRMAGIERADSLVLDPHKGLFLPYGTGALLVRDGETLKRAHALSADYMPAMQEDPDLVDFNLLSPGALARLPGPARLAAAQDARHRARSAATSRRSSPWPGWAAEELRRDSGHRDPRRAAALDRRLPADAGPGSTAAALDAPQPRPARARSTRRKRVYLTGHAACAGASPSASASCRSARTATAWSRPRGHPRGRRRSLTADRRECMTPAAVKPPIPFSTLEAVDIRVGTIRKIEEVPKSDKLLRLTVDFGDHSRTILAGMKGERPTRSTRRAAGALRRQPRAAQDDGRGLGGNALRPGLRRRRRSGARDPGARRAGRHAGRLRPTSRRHARRTRARRRGTGVGLPRAGETLDALAHRAGLEDEGQPQPVGASASRRREGPRHDGHAVPQRDLREGVGIALRQPDPEREAARRRRPSVHDGSAATAASSADPAARASRGGAPDERWSASASRRTAPSCPTSEPPRSAMIFRRVMRARSSSEARIQPMRSPPQKSFESEPTSGRAPPRRRRRWARAASPRATGPRACCPRGSAPAAPARAAPVRGGTPRASPRRSDSGTSA